MPSITIPGPLLEKIKASVTDTISLNPEALNRAHESMKGTLFGKVLGRAPNLEAARETLSRLWGCYGEFTIADMPNGFFVIRCSTATMAEDLLVEGPWSINGSIFHLLRWKEHFEPMYEKLSAATVWVQLNNMPVEYWDIEHLETLVNYFGRLIKVDATTQEMDRAKFIHVCIELDLQKPLKKGVWVTTPKSKSFVSILYERLPVFCYHCGVVGHGANACTEKTPGCRRDAASAGPSPPNPSGKEVVIGEPSSSQRNTGPSDAQAGVLAADELENREYGPWMDANWKRKGKNWKYQGAQTKPNWPEQVPEVNMPAPAEGHVTGRVEEETTEPCHVEEPSRGRGLERPSREMLTRGRGGGQVQSPPRFRPRRRSSRRS
ncbi:hypothetical protein J5N97_011966 [Dioscorea zingiberensis]|uniref:CCHC-type domain-containing protein n=1 Tax=Dioscorea zingiberensis TaxID=325984 RepID=A0A9D5D212_9LILI|nr:hypothetical protein J5N97_011966 [Dioscorea zingiberensis]